MKIDCSRHWLKAFVGTTITVIVITAVAALRPDLSPVFGSAGRSGNANAPNVELWRIAPPAPRITDAERLNELRKRRSEVMKRMGDQSIMVLFSTEPRVYTNDTDYPFRQENNLYYLTTIKQQNVILVLIPGAA